MEDIQDRKDIDRIVSVFYNRLFQDPLLKNLFEQEVKAHLDRHLMVIADFWEFNIFGSKQYKNNMFAAHLTLHEKWKLDENKFNRWLQLFEQSIDENYSGENADKMKINARGIAGVMMSKFRGDQFMIKKK